MNQRIAKMENLVRVAKNTPDTLDLLLVRHVASFTDQHTDDLGQIIIRNLTTPVKNQLNINLRKPITPHQYPCNSLKKTLICPIMNPRIAKTKNLVRVAKTFAIYWGSC